MAHTVFPGRCPGLGFNRAVGAGVGGDQFVGDVHLVDMFIGSQSKHENFGINLVHCYDPLDGLLPQRAA